MYKDLLDSTGVTTDLFVHCRHEKYIYSILATENKKKERKPEVTLHPPSSTHTQTQTTQLHTTR